MKSRPLTGIDRMLDFEDRIDRSVGAPKTKRRRTHRRGRRTLDLSLWREFARVVFCANPRFVVVENVANNATKHWLPAVRCDLHVLGYRTRALRLDARELGAPHARARVFVIGHAHAQAQPARAQYGQVARVPATAVAGRAWRQPLPRTLRMADGLPRGVDRLEALGDAVVPQAAYVAGRVLLDWAQKRGGA